MIAVRCLLLLALALLTGCARQFSPTPVSPSAATFAPELQAGVARADITPPPGLSLFGHGPEGLVSTGTLLRLYCEAFVFTRDREAAAIVPCDLGAPALELQRAIAKRVVDAGVPLGAERIALMATHTHAGPAHYFGPRQYSGTFSSREPGFDPAVLDFLAERISSAIVMAYKIRKPARIGWAIDREAGLGLTRNRSFGPFSANAALPVELADRLENDALRRLHSPAALAVDPTISVLRVDHVAPDGSAKPVGVFTVFGIHNTAIPNTNDLYHSDIFGFAVRTIENHFRDSKKQNVIAGIANGIEGDVSPAVDFQGVTEARRIGEALAQKVIALAEGVTTTADAPLDRAYRELFLPARLAEVPSPFYDRIWGAKQTRMRILCNAPEIGTAAAGGAQDGPTRLRVLPHMNEGTRAEVERSCQGWKLPIFPPSGRFLDDGLDFPATVPITLVRLGDAIVAAAPAEITTVTGVRLREALSRYLATTAAWSTADSGQPSVEQRAPTPASPRVVIVGLTNSYIQYVTSQEEYPYQHYEGASTLYGPDTARFLQNHFLCLARWLYGGAPRSDRDCRMDQPHDVDTVNAVPYAPEVVPRMPEEERVPEPRAVEAVSPKAAPFTLEWKIDFPDVPPSRALMQRLRVRVLAEGEKGAEEIENDAGKSLELRYNDVPGATRQWTARWTPDRATVRARCGRKIWLTVATDPAAQRAQSSRRYQLPMCPPPEITPPIEKVNPVQQEQMRMSPPPKGGRGVEAW